ncbi:MAG: SUMF1/EgtB/PvdO family nonheme iron enzyme, partial [Bacteroidales bacterium]|nr:SUMF1/EgtB/PvdO family nonheme iron enzyme [Bacteroidales bacterium]
MINPNIQKIMKTIIIIALVSVVLCLAACVKVRASQRQASSSQQGSNLVFTIGGVSFTMVHVQGGTFTMGATSEQGDDSYFSARPAHSVTLSPYYIGETEVTQGLWKAVMGSNPSYFSKGDNYPVEWVTYDDCIVFCQK